MTGVLRLFYVGMACSVVDPLAPDRCPVTSSLSPLYFHSESFILSHLGKYTPLLPERNIIRPNVFLRAYLSRLSVLLGEINPDVVICFSRLSRLYKTTADLLECAS